MQWIRNCYSRLLRALLSRVVSASNQDTFYAVVDVSGDVDFRETIHEAIRFIRLNEPKFPPLTIGGRRLIIVYHPEHAFRSVVAGILVVNQAMMLRGADMLIAALVIMFYSEQLLRELEPVFRVTKVVTLAREHARQWLVDHGCDPNAMNAFDPS